MDSSQNCDSYINILLSQTYGSHNYFHSENQNLWPRGWWDDDIKTYLKKGCEEGMK
jgi:hypothetical protein